MIIDYSYANYNSLSSNQKALWWFDEYLRYDLILGIYFPYPFRKFAFLVERHTIDRHLWADNFSYYLWQSACKINNNPKLFNSENCEFIIPTSNLEEKVCITYLTFETNHTSMLNRLGLIFGSGSIISKHQYFCTIKKDIPTQVKIKNCILYSVVVNATKNLATIQSVIEPKFLYKNIDNWITNLNDAKELETQGTIRTYSQMNTGKFKTGTNTVENIRLKLENQINPPPNLPPDTENIIFSSLSFEEIANIQLIYARPPKKLYPLTSQGNNLFSISNNYENKKFGYFLSQYSALDLLFGEIVDSEINNTTEVSAIITNEETSSAASTPRYVSAKPGSYFPVGEKIKPSLTVSEQYHRNANAPWIMLDIVVPSPEADEMLFFNRVFDPDTSQQIGWGVKEYRYSSSQRYNFFPYGSQVPNSGGGSVSHTIWTIWQYWTTTAKKLNPNTWKIINVNPPVIQITNLINQLLFNGEYIMSLELKIQEIHTCLGAGEFAYDSNVNSAYMHLARKVDLIAKALGIAFNLDGSIISLRQSRAIDQGDIIPQGWTVGQFGTNTGNNSQATAQTGGLATEERLGIAYEVKGNKFIENKATGDQEITTGGFVLCESIPQMWHVMLKDLDRSLGLQQLGAWAVANPNYNEDVQGFADEPYFAYNGLANAVFEMLHTLSDTHKQATQANIGALKAQAISQEVLGALGVPVIEKLIKIEVDGQIVDLKYPGFNGSGMTIADLNFVEWMNLAILNEGE